MDNKTFLNRLSERLDMEVKPTEALVGKIIEVFTHTCARLDSIAVPGFGTFAPVKTDEQVVTDTDGNRTLMPPAITLTFKESVVLRKKMN